MKTLKFKSNLIEEILSGVKTSTWRLFDDKDLQKGDELILIEKENGKEFARAIITSITEKKLGDLEESDFEGHGRYESEEKMYEAYKKYYGREVNSESLLKIIYFKLQ